MKEMLDLVNEMSPYILLGFLLAGLLHAFVPNRLYRRYLGGSSFRSVVNATLLGIPLPLCSCGVLPTAMSLRKEGASQGATAAFLIATPQTGIDSILATYAMMGLPFALFRPAAALVTALAGGAFVSRLAPAHEEAAAGTCPTASCCGGEKTGFIGKLTAALQYAFIEMMQDIGRWLAVGLLVAGLITVFVPSSFFALFADKPLLSMLLVLVVAVPMYLCATGSIPIAVALLLKGLSPGTALVLLMAGPAVNVASLLVLSKVMGRRSMLLYLVSIVGGAILCGCGMDYLLPREWFLLPVQHLQTCCTASTSYFHIGWSLLLGGLLVHALTRRDLLRRTPHHCCCQECHEEGLVVQVEGMSCNHCKANVEKVILRLEGVTSVTADLQTGRCVIQGQTTLDAVRQAVESIGFSVR